MLRALETDTARKVFVVHGRNEGVRDAMFQFLRAIGLQPIEWGQAVALTGQSAPFVGDVLEAAFSYAQVVVVLLTGDDEARLKSEFLGENEPASERTLTQQARPNVLFEAGMAFGRSPNRTVLVQLGDLRPFSDIAGRHVVRMNNSTARRQELAQRLAAAGCPINLTGTDWHRIGDFEAATRLRSPALSYRIPSTAINLWLPTTHTDIRIGLFTPQDKATVHETPIESSGYVVGLPQNNWHFRIQAFVITNREYQQGSSYIDQEGYWKINEIHLGATTHEIFYRVYDESGRLFAESSKITVLKINAS